MGSDVKIARALISVTDKTGVVDFARTLVDDFGVEIISTGGTARAIEDAGVPVTPIEEFTGYPEMMDGRVKTLHPKVHGALLARRDSEQHMQEAALAHADDRRAMPAGKLVLRHLFRRSFAVIVAVDMSVPAAPCNPLT